MKIARPRAAATLDPTNRAPNEQIDKSRRALSDEGRNEGACTMGKMGWNLAKYNLMHVFYHIVSFDDHGKAPIQESDLAKHTKKSADGRTSS
jgi:hypothetical protein